MRVLYCNKYNYPFSGTEVYLFELMALMREQGHDVELFSMADPRGRGSRFDAHMAPPVDFKAGSRLQRARRAVDAVYSRPARRQMRRMAEAFRPQVAHVRNIYHHLSPSILWELKHQGIPVLYHLNDFKMLCPSYNMVAAGDACERCSNGQFYRVVQQGCYHGGRAAAAMLATEAYVHRWLRTYERCVDKFLAPSQFVRNKLIESGWNADQIEVLPHFQQVQARRVDPPAEDAPILYFGRLSEEKGVADLLRAMAVVPEAKLWIAGTGPQRDSLESLARDLDLRQVTFLGHLQGDALDNAIAESRFTVLPSRAYETLGKTILESYARGRAVVASDLGSRRELVQDGVTGLLYEVGNAEQLAKAIRTLCSRPDLATRMGETGLRFVLEHHSKEAHYQSMMEIYQELSEGADESPKRLLSFPGAKRMRVAFIGGRGVVSRYSGIEAYYEEAGGRLAAMGHEVTVYCRNHFTPPIKEHRGMKIVRLPTIRSKHLETLVHTFLSTAHALFRRYDVVHYHALGPALFSGIPRLLGAKTAVTVQGLDGRRKKWGRIASAVLRLGEKAAARLPNATMVVSRTLQDYYRSQYRASTVFVPNGTELLTRTEGAHLTQWGLESGNYILYLGRFSPEKNCHLLLEAFAKLQTGVKLVFAGGSSYTDEYGRQLRQNAGPQVVFLNWVEGASLHDLLTHAMLFVLPSDLEGLSLALLDAMGAGVCVLTSDIPENREVVEDAGFLFRRGDVADLERMLRLLISDPIVRGHAAAAARKKVRERYLWPGIARQIDAVYRSVTSIEQTRQPSRDRAHCEKQRHAAMR